MIELMVVIGIIALLMSAIIVGVQGVRKRAMKSAVKGQLSKIELKIEQYKQKYGKYPDGSRCPSMYAPALFNLMTDEQRLFAMLFQSSSEYTQEDIKEQPVLNASGYQVDEAGNYPQVVSGPAIVPELIDKYGNRIGFHITRTSYFIYSLGDDGVTAFNDGLDNDGDGDIDLNSDGTMDEESTALDGKVGDDIVAR